MVILIWPLGTQHCLIENRKNFKAVNYHLFKNLKLIDNDEFNHLL